MTATQQPRVYDIKDAGQFVLPAGRVLRHFEAQSNYSILAPTENGPFDGFGVVDSIHTRALKGEPVSKAVADLLKRNGAIEVKKENTYTINGTEKYVLPEGKLLQQFEAQQTLAVLVEDEKGIFSGRKIEDSIHLRAYRNPDERHEAIVTLLKRSGAQPLPQVA